MKILPPLYFAQSPEGVTQASYDCLWIELASEHERGLTSPALQWIDWKLHGQISRYLATEKEAASCITFIPTLKQLVAPYLVLSPQKLTDWGLFFKNCEGLRLRNVLYFCEAPGRLEASEQALREQGVREFPEEVTFASDGPAID